MVATSSSRLTSSPSKLKWEEEKKLLLTDGSTEVPRSSLKGQAGQLTRDMVCSLNNDLAEDRWHFGQAGVMCPLSSNFPEGNWDIRTRMMGNACRASQDRFFIEIKTLWVRATKEGFLEEEDQRPWRRG